MKKSKWIIFALLLGSARLGMAQSSVQFWSGQATISTSNCNNPNTTPPGLCQPAPACNNGAGSNPDTIQASVSLCEVSASTFVVLPDGGSTWVRNGTLTGGGIGTGFRPGATYVSFIQRDQSTATCYTPYTQGTAGPVMLGIWKVNPDGTATLKVDTTVSGVFTDLNSYYTVSVREMQPPNAACFNCTSDPVPQLSALRACGGLTVTPTTSCTLP